MYSKIENFLLDVKANDEVFDYQQKEYKLHKEHYDERFDLLYIKENDHTLRQNRNYYNLCGYYDNKDHCIYNAENFLTDKIQESDVIKFDRFENLNQKILDAVKKYINDYCFSHEKELTKLAQEKYEAKDDTRIFEYKKEINKMFITQDNPTADLTISINNYDIDYDNNIISYLNNPTKAVEEISKKFIERYGQSYGLELLIYHDKVSYLEELKENKDNSYNDIHCCKNILNSIKYVDAKTVNITIQYGENSLTFKYELDDLRSALASGKMETSTYNNGYGIVSDFVKANDPSIANKNQWRCPFSIPTITSITSGRNEIYSKETPNIEKEVEEDLEIEM